MKFVQMTIIILVNEINAIYVFENYANEAKTYKFISETGTRINKSSYIFPEIGKNKKKT